MLSVAIGIVLYNRPQYTRQLFSALAANDYVKQFPVYISIDFSQRTNELLAIIKRSALSIVQVKINKPKRGCGLNHIDLINRIKEDDFIILEDDTIPLAHDTLNYFYSNFPQLKGDNLFSICGYNRDGDKECVYDTYTHNHFCPWGFAMTKRKWHEVHKQVFDKQWSGSWDTVIHQGIANKNSICPMLSRIQNVGAVRGVHVPSKEWHAINHHVKFGAWDIGIQKRELGKWKD
jgi:hypothetical protein